MSLSLYRKQQSTKQLLVELDYDNPTVNLFLEKVGKESGLYIDYYGDTVLYLTHLKALRDAAQQLMNKNHSEIMNFYRIICDILKEGIPPGVSYIFVGD